MGTCWNCGRRGLFLRLGMSGRCIACEQEALQKAEAEKKRIAELHKRFEIERQQQLSQFRNFFPLDLKNDRTAPFLSIWGINTHNDENQIRRQRRALCETIPIEINTKLCSATFISRHSNKIYITDIANCSCADFSDRGLPCKHMYRLFYELNHTPQNYGILDIPNTILDKFANLSNDAKLKFIDFCKYGRSGHQKLMSYNNPLNELVMAGMIEASAVLDYTPLLGKLTKDEIILILAKNSIVGYRPSWTKVKLIEWISTEQIGFLKKHFRNYALFHIAPDLTEWAESIYTEWNRYHIDTSSDPFVVPNR